MTFKKQSILNCMYRLLQKILKRQIYFYIFLFIFLLLGSGYYIEYKLLIDPCPLCIFQRIMFYGIGITSLLSFIFKFKSILRKISNILIALFSILGIILAGRQIWLQHLPKELAPSCSAGLERMMELYPLLDVFKKVLKGTAECASVDFEILYLPISNWSMLSFVLLLIISYLIIKKGGPKST